MVKNQRVTIPLVLFFASAALDPSRETDMEEDRLSNSSPNVVDVETAFSSRDQVALTSSDTGDSACNHKEAIVVTTGESDTGDSAYNHAEAIVVTTGESYADLELINVDESSSSLCSDDEARLLMEVLEDD